MPAKNLPQLIFLIESYVLDFKNTKLLNIKYPKIIFKNVSVLKIYKYPIKLAYIANEPNKINLYIQIFNFFLLSK
jgi:hypothetical protein